LSPLAAQAEFAWARAFVSLVLLMTPGGPFTSPAKAAAAEAPMKAVIQNMTTSNRVLSTPTPLFSSPLDVVEMYRFAPSVVNPCSAGVQPKLRLKRCALR
jgi:hypothetical protein